MTKTNRTRKSRSGVRGGSAQVNALTTSNCSGASGCGVAAYGMNPSAIQGTNLVQVTPVQGGGVKYNKNKGGSFINEIAVPAVLLYANTAFKPKKYRGFSKKNNSRRVRFTKRRFRR